MKAKFVAIQDRISDIKGLDNLNTVILAYVTDEVEPFATTHLTTVNNKIR